MRLLRFSKNVERDLETYDAEIVRLETRKLFLASQKARLKTYAAQIQSLLSPVRTIPSEILQRIFDMSCDTNRFDVVNINSTSKKPAMAISSVCSLWRKNALSMRSIWSRITLEWRWDHAKLKAGFDENDHERILSTLADFLARSQQQPLSLIVNIPTCE
ncbi:hypothetical protein BDP27DRAFT_1208991, partial [Rhodocollybia butyracea]